MNKNKSNNKANLDNDSPSRRRPSSSPLPSSSSVTRGDSAASPVSSKFMVSLLTGERPHDRKRPRLGIMELSSKDQGISSSATRRVRNDGGRRMDREHQRRFSSSSLRSPSSFRGRAKHQEQQYRSSSSSSFTTCSEEKRERDSNEMGTLKKRENFSFSRRGGRGRTTGSVALSAGVSGLASPVPLSSISSSSPAVKQFSACIPSEVDLTQARNLRVSQCRITSVPSILSLALTRICALDLSHNDLSVSHDLSLLTSMPQLTSLNISHNPHLGESLAFLLGSINRLSNSSSFPSPPSLAASTSTPPSLVVLSVAYCGLRSLKGLEACRSTLKTLVANDNQLVLLSPSGEEAIPGDNTDSTGEEDSSSSVGDTTGSAAERLQGIETYQALESAHLLETVILSRNTSLGKLCPPTPISSSRPFSSSSFSSVGVLTDSEEQEDVSASHQGSTTRVKRNDGKKGGGKGTEENNATPNTPDKISGKNSEKDPANQIMGKSEERVSMEDGPEKWLAQEEKGNKHPLSVFAHLSHLKKLSLSECGIHSLPSRFFLPLVTELRLSHNALTSLHPDGFIARSLHVLDVSHNNLTQVNTFRRFKYLQQLNLRGNPVFEAFCARDVKEYGYSAAVVAQRLPPSLKTQLRRMLPELLRIDGVDVKEADPPPVMKPDGPCRSSSTLNYPQLSGDGKGEDNKKESEEVQEEDADDVEEVGEKKRECGQRKDKTALYTSTSSRTTHRMTSQEKMEKEGERKEIRTTPTATGTSSGSRPSTAAQEADLYDVVVDIACPPSSAKGAGASNVSVVRRERHYHHPVRNKSTLLNLKTEKNAKKEKKKGKDGISHNECTVLRGSKAVEEVLKAKQGFQGGW